LHSFIKVHVVKLLNSFLRTILRLWVHNWRSWGVSLLLWGN
jgi:hypothetical protein